MTRRSRWLIRLTVGMILAVGLVFGLLLTAAPTVTQLGLRLAGIDDVTLRDLQAGLRGLEIGGLQIGRGPALAIDHLRLDYRLQDLVDGRVDRLVIDGLTLKGEIRDGRLVLQGSDPEAAGAPALPALALPAEVDIRNGRIDLEGYGLTGRLPFALQAHRRPDAERIDVALQSADARLETAGPGSLMAGLELEASLPADLAAGLVDIEAVGRLRLDADHAAVLAADQRISGTGEIAFKAKDGRLEARTEDLGAVLADTVTVGLGRRALPFGLDLAPAGNGWALTLVGPLDLKLGDDLAAADLTASLELDDALRPIRLEEGRLSAEVDRLRASGVRLEDGRLEISLEGPLDALDAALEVGLGRLASVAAGPVIERFAWRQRLRLARDAGGWAATPAEDGVLRFRASDAGRGLETGEVSLRFLDERAPWVRFYPLEGAWSTALAAELLPFRLKTEAGTVFARIERLETEARGRAGAASRASLRIEEGRVDLPAQDLFLAGIAATVPLVAGGLPEGVTIPLTIRNIRHDREPAWFAPLRSSIEFRPEAESLAFAGRLVSRAPLGVELNVEGRHDLADGAGAATLNLAALDFEPDGLQPGQILPVLAEALREVSGRLALAGGLTWGDGGLPSDLELLIEGLGFTIGPARVSDVNGVLRVDRLLPPTTPPDQQLAVGLLDLGLPLTDGLVHLQLKPHLQLQVDELTWNLADGRVRAEPFTFGSDVSALSMVLHAEDLDLDGLFGLTRLDGLSGEGLVDGRLPLTIEAGAARIDGGELSARGPGVIRYRREAAPSALEAGGQGVGLLLEALENFRYDALRITLDGRTDSAMDIGLHLEGANPELYDGHPVEFNLNLDGALAQILQSGLRSYQIPDRIRERIQGFGEGSGG